MLRLTRLHPATTPSASRPRPDRRPGCPPAARSVPGSPRRPAAGRGRPGRAGVRRRARDAAARYSSHRRVPVLSSPGRGTASGAVAAGGPASRRRRPGIRSVADAQPELVAQLPGLRSTTPPPRMPVPAARTGSAARRGSRRPRPARARPASARGRRGPARPTAAGSYHRSADSRSSAARASAGLVPDQHRRLEARRQSGRSAARTQIRDRVEVLRSGPPLDRRRGRHPVEPPAGGRAPPRPPPSRPAARGTLASRPGPWRPHRPSPGGSRRPPRGRTPLAPRRAAGPPRRRAAAPRASARPAPRRRARPPPPRCRRRQDRAGAAAAARLPAG